MNRPLRSRTLLWLGVVSALGFFLPLSTPAQGPEATQEPAFAMGNGRLVRGTIAAVANDRFTIKTERGETYQVVLTANTRLRHGRDPLKVSDVHVGDGAGAMGEMDESSRTVHALFVAIVSAEDLKKARDAMGKTFISGNVTALDETKLTVHRTDGVTQTIQVDEDTSFRRGGRGMQMVLGNDAAGGGERRTGNSGATGSESITLADIKVGDLIAGPGALKNGVFTASQLAVSDPALQRSRGRREGTGASASKPSEPNE